MENVIFIVTIAIYVLLYAIYFFGFKRSGNGLIYSRYVVVSITIVGSFAMGYFIAVYMQTGVNSFIWGIVLFGLGLLHAVWRFVRL